MTAKVLNSPNTNMTAFMSFTGCGVAADDSLAASVTQSGIGAGFVGHQASTTYLVTCTTGGSQIFTAKYRVNAGTGVYQFRQIVVIPLP